MKYALGLNPLVPCKAGILPSGHITNVSGAHYIDFQFRRLKGSGTGTTERGYTVGGLTYVVEVSSDLVNWSTGAALMSQLGLPIDNGDSSETVTVRVNPPASSGKKQFVRLKVISLKH